MRRYIQSKQEGGTQLRHLVHQNNLNLFQLAWLAAMRRVHPMKRLMTEKARSEAFRPTASIRNTADSEPKRAPSASKLPAKSENTQGIETCV